MHGSIREHKIGSADRAKLTLRERISASEQMTILSDRLLVSTKIISLRTSSKDAATTA